MYTSPLTLRGRLVLSLLLTCMLHCSCNVWAQVEVKPAITTVSGWRGDGSGRYPNADPPLAWGRTARSVKEHSAQARKPQDGALPAQDAAIPDGVIRQWLVLGPLPIPEGAKAEDLIPDAAALAPDANEKTANLNWRTVTQDSSCMDLCALLNVPPETKGFAAYACTYLYSPSGGPVVLNALSQGQGCQRIWLNGKEVYFTGKDVDLDFFGARLVLQLQKGWNRLLILHARTVATRKSWWISVSLYGDNTTEYDTHGIAWMTPIPSPGSSAPVIMGDRLFFTAESGSLYCIDKADGKILWVRSLNYYDFVTDEERKAAADAFVELDLLAQRVRQMDELDAVMPWKMPALEKDWRGVIEDQLLKKMVKVSEERYGRPATWGCEAGFTAHTPVTDGRRVYVLYGTGVVAAYDRDGNCIWKRLLQRRMVEHGYTTSPLLVDGKLVIYFDSFAELDPQTGAVVLERPRFLPQGKSFQQNAFYGAGCVLSAGGEKVVYYPNGEFVRLSDGKTLSCDPNVLQVQNNIITPVSDGGLAYTILHVPEQTPEGGEYAVSFRLPGLQEDKVNPEIACKASLKMDKVPYYYNSNICASPLVHDGLMYSVTVLGTLIVVDMEQSELLYQRQLDLDIFMPYNGGLLKGGASSSPTLAGKYIYIWGNQGTCVVLEPGRAFKQVARNRVENFYPGRPAWREATITNPIFEGGRMYYRAERALYCIGAK